MPVRGEVWRLLEDDAGARVPPASPGGPVLELLASECGEEPAPFEDGSTDVGDLQLNLIKGARNQLGTTSRVVHGRQRKDQPGGCLGSPNWRQPTVLPRLPCHLDLK